MSTIIPLKLFNNLLHFTVIPLVITGQNFIKKIFQVPKH